MGRQQSKSARQSNEAKATLTYLFQQAMQAGSKKYADRYVQLARQIGTKFKIPLTSSQKRKFCKACGVFFIPSQTCRVRVRGGHTIYTCLNCKTLQRIPYHGKKAAKR